MSMLFALVLSPIGAGFSHNIGPSPENAKEPVLPRERPSYERCQDAAAGCGETGFRWLKTTSGGAMQPGKRYGYIP
jgi:hypothetical protein